MENESRNLYKAPESELDVKQESEGVGNFKRFSAWGVFGLSIITFGIYPLYWMYTRAKQLNTFHHNQISPNVLFAFLISIIVSFSFGFVGGIYEDNTLISSLDGLFTLVYFILYLTVLFSLHNRLKEITGDNLNPVITFFGSVIYFQYKINVAIDRNQ
jgi:magnesium-transporting ATPase (P-type)